MTASLQTPLQTRVRTIDGLAIRFAESEPRAVSALLLCPWPESLFAYEATWPKLAQQAHLVAVDLPGFGHSERRDDLLAPRAMGEFVVRIADAFGLEKPHVVAPDVGTGASLFAAAVHPGRFRSLVVGTGATAFPLQLGSPLLDWIQAPDLDVYRRTDAREIVGAAIATLQRYRLSKAAREDYLSSYEGDRFVESIRYVRAYPAELPILATLLPTIETPVQIIAGKHDTIVPPVNAEFLHERLPHSKLDLIDSGHFIWEDAAEEYGSIVAAWWKGGYAEA